MRAVRKDTVMFAFKTAYQTEHPDTNANAVEQAWWRALRQAKGTAVVEGMVEDVHHLWRPAYPTYGGCSPGLRNLPTLTFTSPPL